MENSIFSMFLDTIIHAVIERIWLLPHKGNEFLFKKKTELLLII